MHYRKTFTPLYEHRPSVLLNQSPEKLCAALGYDYMCSESYKDLPVSENVPLVVCGAGIIPQDIITRYTVINSHPGYIPLVRGLDAFKWAIIEDKPVGVTTHLIGGEVDAGEIIRRKIVPIYKNDTFHAAAQRVYETEILMLAESLTLLHEEREHIPAGNNELHRRMPHDVERGLLRAFDDYVSRRGIERVNFNMSGLDEHWDFDVVGVSTIDYPVDNTIMCVLDGESDKLRNIAGCRYCVVVAGEGVRPDRETCRYNFFIHDRDPEAKFTELVKLMKG